MPVDFEIIQKLSVALLLGALIGLEREHSVTKDHRGDQFAGIRTLTLFSILGAIAQIFFANQQIFIWIFSIFIFLLITAGYIVSSIRTKTIGSTTELASMGVYLIGLISGRGDFFVATTLTLLILIILHFKNPLHEFARRISKEELTSTVKFMILAFIILPLLPNKTYGPYEVLNPYLIWLMVVFITGISFASYLAIKFLGQKRGIGLTGFFAGFVSSTALALSFSNESKKRPAVINPFVFAIVLASSAMFFRVLVEISVLNPALLKYLSVPLGLMGIMGCVLAISYWRKKETTPQSIEEKRLKTRAEKLESPFTLRPALKFAFVFAIILFLSKLAGIYFGPRGIYVTSFLSGIFDVDAITVSLANLAKDDLSEKVASQAILIAAGVNTLSKGILFYIFGNKRVARSIIFLFITILIVGLVSHFILA